MSVAEHTRTFWTRARVGVLQPLVCNRRVHYDNNTTGSDDSSSDSVPTMSHVWELFDGSRLRRGREASMRLRRSTAICPLGCFRFINRKRPSGGTGRVLFLSFRGNCERHRRIMSFLVAFIMIYYSEFQRRAAWGGNYISYTTYHASVFITQCFLHRFHRD